MRARITVAVVAILALALTIAGVVSALLLRSAARSAAQRTVLTQTQAFVSSVDQAGELRKLISGQSSDSITLLGQVLNLVRNITGANANDLVVASNGQLYASDPLINLSAPQRLGLVACDPASGLQGNQAYAAVPLVCHLASLGDAGTAGSGTGTGSGAGSSSASSSTSAGSTSSSTPAPATIAIVLSEPVSYSADSVWYFVLAAGVALAAAGVVATLIASRVSRHVVAAAGAAEAIASGDLAVRVSQRDRVYPELSALGSAINTMAAGLERARQLERQFLLSVSHDLRTPLTSIRGYTEAIADGAVPDPAAAAEVVLAEVARLERLIRDLLDLAYLDAQRFSLHLARIDLQAAVRTAAEALRLELAAQGVSLEVTAGDEPLEVDADGDRVAQIVANLVENAGKYARTSVVVRVGRPPGRAGPLGEGAGNGRSPAGPGGAAVSPGGAAVGPGGPAGGTGGPVVIPGGTGDGLPAEPAVALSVEDDGPGIAGEDLPHVFERLYTSDRLPSRAARGTGLGLAIVSELAAAMGGSVLAESPTRPDGGTRITVRLPLHQRAVPADHSVPA